MIFDLYIPVETRLAFLKDWKSYQLREIQFYCEHKNFMDGSCELCDYECEHSDAEDNHCLDCGEFMEPFDIREEPESMEDR